MVDLIVIFVFLLIAIVLIVISFIANRNIKKNCSLKIEAVVETKESHHDYGSNHNHRIVVYGYNYKGIHYVAPAKTRLGQGPIGSTHEIIIDPKKPQDCYRKEDLILPKVLLWSGIYMFCFSMFFGIKIASDILR